MNDGLDLPFTVKPTWKQHLCYEALTVPVMDPDHLDEDDPLYGPLTVEVFFGGGADGGKSWAICESRLMNAYKYPGYKSFIGRHELKRLMQSTYKTWMKVCRYHNIPSDEWRLDGSLHTIKFTNGSEIDLLDLSYRPVEDPLYERFGSLEYSDGAIEEAGEVHPLAREVMKSRCGRWMNDELKINPSLLCTGNPKKNWTYHLFYKPSIKGMLPPDRKFIQALHKDNEYGQRSYGKNLDRITDPVMRARLRDGNWEYEDDPKTLIKYAAISDMYTNHVASDDEDEDGLTNGNEMWMTVDVARYGGDKTVVTIWRGWTAVKILWREKQGIDESTEWVKGIAYENEIPYSHICIDEDGVGGGIVDNMRGVRGFVAGSAPIETDDDEDEEEIESDDPDDDETTEKNPTKRIAFANLKTQCGYYLADQVNYHRIACQVRDTEIKEWLTADLEQIKEENIDSDRKRTLVPKEEVKIVLGRSPDFGDTFVMRAVFDLRPPGRKQETWQHRPKMQNRRRRG